MRHVDIAVLGGGISGLACGFWLDRAGRDVVLIERSPEPGGCIRTLRREGWTFEMGPNTIVDPSGAVDRLNEAAGLHSRIRRAGSAASKRFIYRAHPRGEPGLPGRLLELPTSPFAFVRTPILSARAKLRVLREAFIPAGPGDVEESVASFVRRRLGPEFLDRIVDPFVSGVFAGDPDRLSLRWSLPRIHALEQEHGSLIRGALALRKGPSPSAEPLSYRDGLSELPRALAAALGERVLLGTAAMTIERTADGYVMDLDRGHGMLEVLHARRVILATPADAARSLLACLSLPLSEMLGGIPYAPVVSVALGFPRGPFASRLDGFGFLAPRNQGLGLLGCLFSSSMFEERAPAGCVALTVLAGGAGHPEVIDRADGALLTSILSDLRRALGPLPEPVFVHVARWPRAIPQYNLGHGRFVQAARELERRYARLHITGNFLGGVSVGDCVRNAGTLCEEIVSEGEEGRRSRRSAA